VSGALAGHRASGFFVLRTPLLPFDELCGWTAAAGDETDGARRAAALRHDLQARLARPELRAALAIASPDLVEALPHWEADPTGKRGRRVEQSLVRYFLRMAGRSVPFGAFAGCTLGRLDESSELLLVPRERYRRVSRLDMGYLYALAHAVRTDQRLRAELEHHPNPTLYRAGGVWRYVQARRVAGRLTFALLSVEHSDALASALGEAAPGCRPDDLAAALARELDVATDEARAYVGQLIDAQVLTAELEPSLTGEEPAASLAAACARGALRPIGASLTRARAQLAAADEAPLAACAAAYARVAGELRDLPARPAAPQLVQVDLYKPADAARLSWGVADELARALGSLQRLAQGAGRARPLTRFAQRFAQRYGERWVPLVEALDPDFGPGPLDAEPAAWTTGSAAGLPAARAREETRFTARDRLLLEHLTRALAEGRTEMRLKQADLEHLPTGDARPLPDALGVVASLAARDARAIDRGEFRVRLLAAGGPSGVYLLGRFCHLDPEIERHVRLHLRAEEALRPDAVYAEIVHLPDYDRFGNFTHRPVLRDHELPYLGRSGRDAAGRLDARELLVGVDGERVLLRSPRLGRQVLPRLTTAHAYARGDSLPLYRFLCALSKQHVEDVLTFSWGPLDAAAFLPRVVLGRVVLSPATWRLAEHEARELAESNDARATLGRWRARVAAPRFVECDELPLDLDNDLAAATLARMVAQGARRLSELDASALCVRAPEGAFVHQLVMPFVRVAGPSAEPVAPPASCTTWPKRRPGGEWLSLRIALGPAAVDAVLATHLAPVISALTAAGVVSRWFFLRYGDPEWHLRLRLRGQPRALREEAWPALAAVLDPLAEAGPVDRVQLDTYDPEVVRYGGEQGLELAEQVFHADSQAVLELLALAETEDADQRWRAALVGVRRLLDDLALDSRQRYELLAALARGGERHFALAGGSLRRLLARRYRAQASALTALLEGRSDLARAITPALERRSTRLRPLARDLHALARDGRLTHAVPVLAASFAHMFVNRLLPGEAPAQETVISAFLERQEASRRACAAAGASR
jgi:thiopeptide-type bacteriocin biosynthesis protein